MPDAAPVINNNINLRDLTTSVQNIVNAINNANQTLAALHPLIFTTPPATAVSAGSPGQIAVDASFLYLAVGVNQWKRVSISSW